MTIYFRIAGYCIAILAFTHAASHSALEAQQVEEHETEQLRPAEVGPYRPQQTPQLGKVEQSIVEQTNAFRHEQGKGPVEINPKLMQTARDFASFMAQKDLYGHQADDHTPAERVRNHEYDYCLVAENIAYEFQTSGFETKELAEGLFGGWKRSPPHRKNMLDADVMEIGVSVAQSHDTGVFYSVQLFARPESAAIQFTILNRTADSVGYRLGDRDFTLPSQYTRTHVICRSAKLSLPKSTGENSAAAERFTVKSGERYVISQHGDDLQIEREPKTKPSSAQ